MKKRILSCVAAFLMILSLAAEMGCRGGSVFASSASAMSDPYYSDTVSRFIANDKFAELLANLSEKDADALNRYYMESSVAPEMMELRTAILSNSIIRPKVAQILEKAGFTREDAAAQMALAEERGAFAEPEEEPTAEEIVEAPTAAAVIKEIDMEVGNNANGLEFVRDMKIGWNLGNTFDAPDGETSWGNPVTTKELILLVKELGFDTIRIPISWGRHVSEAPEYKISESFMARVDTVVNQALDAGLYVIINSHHDNDIYSPTPENCEHGKEYLTAIWTQIGEHFKYADYHLIFETMNEPRVVGTSYEWSVSAQNKKAMASVQVVNELNQAALDAMRATGGRNADRFVIISPYAGSVDSLMMDAFKLPQDSAEGKLIVSVHAYIPYNFALNVKSKEATFTKNMESEIRSFMKKVYYRFVYKGIPVVIDEMGCLNKNNDDHRYAWCKAYVAAAKEKGLTCIWWDNGAINGSGENYGLIDRRKLKIYPQSMTAYQGLMDGLAIEE